MSNMIVQATFNPRCTAKTAEILSKYRPIAPKPETPPHLHTSTAMAGPSSPGEVTSSSRTIFPQNIRQAPYLMNVWPNMQARPIRTRKRGRTSVAPPTPPPITINKRPRTHLIAISPSYPLQATVGFPHSPHQFVTIPGLITLHEYDNNSSPRMVTLPLLPSIPILTSRKYIHMGIDLNKKAPDEIPEERDFLQQLQGNPNTFFTPQPVRPVSSSISVGTINQELCLSLISNVPIAKKEIIKKKEEVEEELESEALPVVVSDSNNRIRVVNSAYKEMVGQPECLWLESCASCKRICGEVILHFSKSNTVVLPSTNGFSCWVKIDWGRKGDYKSGSVTAFCDVKELACEAKEYLYAWKFHTGSGSEACESSTT